MQAYYNPVPLSSERVAASLCPVALPFIHRQAKRYGVGIPGELGNNCTPL
ncbi:MAG: hypothetical protein LH702_30375 [Phormidesmis sp. CAN_BIN44]|nr:hypothetical protein [Phormidesmis sp. CAN_BIN44]